MNAPVKSAFTVRLDPRVREALDRAAQTEGRTVSNAAGKAITDWLTVAGYLKT